MRIVLVKNQDLLKSKKLIEIKTSFEVIPILGNIIPIFGNIIQRYKMSKMVNRFLLAVSGRFIPEIHFTKNKEI